MKKGFSILSLVAITIYFLQSCCNEGIKYVNIDPSDYYAFNVGDTLEYTNTANDTQRYVVTSYTKEQHISSYTPPDDCHSSEKTEEEVITFRNVDNYADSTNTFWISPKLYRVLWNNYNHRDNAYQAWYDSLNIDNYMYKKVTVFHNLIFNFKYGVIQYTDTINHIWTLKNPDKQ